MISLVANCDFHVLRTSEFLHRGNVFLAFVLYVMPRHRTRRIMRQLAYEHVALGAGVSKELGPTKLQVLVQRL